MSLLGGRRLFFSLSPDKKSGVRCYHRTPDFAFVTLCGSDGIDPAMVTYVDGGAVNYAAHAAARLGVKVVVVTHLASEDERVVEKFIQSGIDCLPTYTPQSTCMRLEYPTTNPDVRDLSVTGTADSITASEVENLHAKSAVIGSSLRGEVGLDVIRALHRKNVLLAADVQGYVRVLREHELKYEPWDEMGETLAYLDTYPCA